jgi:hypothetical protein
MLLVHGTCKEKAKKHIISLFVRCHTEKWFLGAKKFPFNRNIKVFHFLPINSHLIIACIVILIVGVVGIVVIVITGTAGGHIAQY